MEIIVGAPSLAAGIRAAAKATGYSPANLREMLAGRRVPEFRRAFQLLLEASGADIETCAQVVGEAMRAREYKYHPAEEEFVSFPDHRTRLRAAQHATKMLELEPPVGNAIQIGVGVTIKTNLGSGETIDPPNIFRAFPVKGSE